MNLNEVLLPEFEHEMNITRKVLNELSDDILAFQPHDKSWSTRSLANHIVEIPTWVNGTLDQDELDFATSDYKPHKCDTKKELIDLFENNVNNARESLKKTNNDKMLADWTLRNGEKIYFTMPRAAVLRSMVISHLIHHRAQLGVYLRLNDAKVPSSYGDSADEKNMFD